MTEPPVPATRPDAVSGAPREGGARRRLGNVLALGVGSAPGFFLSFATLLLLPSGMADTFLVGVTISLAIVGLCAGTYEASMVAAFGRLIVHGGRPRPAELRRAIAHAVRQCAPATVLLSPFLLFVLMATASRGSSFLDLCALLWPLWLAPVLASATSVWSGLLIAHGRLQPVFLAVALRGGPALVALVALRDVRVLAITYTLGEALRFLALRRAARHFIAAPDEAGPPDAFVLPRLSEWLLQASSMAVGQVTPITNKFFLGRGPVGAIATGDAAEKVFFAFNQISTSAIVLPSVARLPRLFTAPEREDRRRALVGEARRVATLAVGLAAAGLVLDGLAVLLLRDVLPARIESALAWALILLAALPFGIVNAWSARVLLFTSHTRWLPRAAVVSVVVNLVLNVSFLPLGISPLVQVSAAIAFVAACTLSISIALAKGPDYRLATA